MARGGATRFQPGQSGNPGGRPKARRPHVSAFDIVLDQSLAVTQGEEERALSIDEALELQTYQAALKGSRLAIRKVLKMIEKREVEAIEKARASRGDDLPVISKFIVHFIGDGVDAVIGTLGMAVLRYPTDKDRVRWELNPWIVEAALARLGKKRLSEDEQREVWANTRTPYKVNWPEWWTLLG